MHAPNAQAPNHIMPEGANGRAESHCAGTQAAVQSCRCLGCWHTLRCLRRTVLGFLASTGSSFTRGGGAVSRREPAVVGVQLRIKHCSGCAPSFACSGATRPFRPEAGSPRSRRSGVLS